MSRVRTFLKKHIPEQLYFPISVRRGKRRDQRLIQMQLERVRAWDAPAARELEQRLLAQRTPSVFFGDWVEKYKNAHYELRYDKGKGSFFALLPLGEGKKRLYFPKGWCRTHCELYLRGILREQDEESPHSYLSGGVYEEIHARGGIALDLGCAEGIFALSVADLVDTVYCFEPDGETADVLMNSFSDFPGKAQIVKKYVSDHSDETTTSIDDFFGTDIPENISVIKMDIEGYEQRALIGMKRVLERNPQAILLVCAYHTNEAEDEIRQILEPLGYTGACRAGEMFFFYDSNLSAPFLRHGVIVFRKQAEEAA